MPADHGVSTNPPAGRQRSREDEIQLSSRSTRCPGSIICPPHLAQDLSFAQDLRIETGTDKKEVANRGHAMISKERDFPAVLDPGQPQKPGFTRQLEEVRAADIVYGLLSEELYLLFCGERGWTAEEWLAWVTATLSGQLFPDLQLRSDT